MKSKISIVIIVIFLASICILSKTIAGYQDNAIDIQNISREKTIEIESEDGSIIEDMYVSTNELKEIIKEQVSKAEESGNSDLWIKENTEEVVIPNAVTQKDIVAIAELDKLQKLDIVISGENIDLSPLSHLSKLQEVSITFSTGDKTDLSFLKELNQLTDITIDRCCEIDDLSLFENKPCLKKLFLEYVENVDLSYLTNCTELRELHIVGGHIRNAEGLFGLFYLKDLYLFDNYRYLQEEEPMTLNLYSFTNMKELEWILLAYVNITDISSLSNLPYLRDITLVNTDVDNIQPMSNLPNLSDLQIYGNRSERVKEQAEMYFNHVENVTVTEEIPNMLAL